MITDAEMVSLAETTGLAVETAAALSLSYYFFAVVQAAVQAVVAAANFYA